MLISLVLGYQMCQNCSMGTYSEGLTLGAKNKIKKCMDLYTRGRGFVLGDLRPIPILWFCLETIYFNKNKYCYILLNNLILSSVAERVNQTRHLYRFKSFLPQERFRTEEMSGL